MTEGTDDVIISVAQDHGEQRRKSFPPFTASCFVHSRWLIGNALGKHTHTHTQTHTHFEVTLYCQHTMMPSVKRKHNNTKSIRTFRLTGKFTQKNTSFFLTYPKILQWIFMCEILYKLLHNGVSTNSCFSEWSICLDSKRGPQTIPWTTCNAILIESVHCFSSGMNQCAKKPNKHLFFKHLKSTYEVGAWMSVWHNRQVFNVWSFTSQIMSGVLSEHRMLRLKNI